MRRLSTGRLLALVFVVAALAAIAVGFAIIGSPWVQRERALDARRSDDLASLAWAIEDHRRAQGALPATLDALGGEWSDLIADPETGAPYEYEATGPETYRLCAVFTHPRGVEGDPRWTGDFMRHGAGRHCFDRDVPEDDEY
ncbi:MAG: hypothetical protein SGJ07_03405 [Rhodospirillaceae bacterium]|nr:hypothetical protein [Rhodospirillaceae bacterium]